MKVTCLGIGKLGSCLAAWLASAGHTVYCVDVNEANVDAINGGKAPVDEPGLQELITANHSRMHGCSSDCSEGCIHSSDFVFVVVPTPSKPDGSFSAEYVLRALEPVAAAIKVGASPVVVIVSTLSPGTMDSEIVPFLERETGRTHGKAFHCVYGPTFIALGSVLENLRYPDYMIIGGLPESRKLAVEFYRTVFSVQQRPPMAQMFFVNAELAKILTNGAITMKISFANSVAELCGVIPGADAREVCRAIGMDSRIGSKYMMPATRFGGECFPRDNRAIMACGRKHHVVMTMAMSTDLMNNRTTEWLIDFVYNDRKFVTIAILGLSFKPGTGVVTESAGMKVIQELHESRDINVHDPMSAPQITSQFPRVTRFYTGQQAVAEADVTAITTPWPEYRELKPSDFKPGSTIIDCWSVLNYEAFTAAGLNVIIPGKGPTK